MFDLLEKVNSPLDLKELSVENLSAYATQVRDFIMQKVTQNGGHLSSNLGIVELTIALHYVFSSPQDKIIFDVGHQSYTHKIITGRKDGFDKLRHDGGITGFPNERESEHDHFTTGHSSTSLSLGVGMARARDIQNQDYNVVSVIGDGAFTGGMAYEALNDIGANKEKMIIVLNDNNMSISKNVGAFSQYLAKLRLSKKYTAIKYNVKKSVKALPFFGDRFVRVLDRLKDNFKFSLIPNKMFENFGVKYYGPFDGHDIPTLINVLKMIKNTTRPVLLHVVTKKGKGVEMVEESPGVYHGVSPVGDNKSISYSWVVSEKICEMASNDNKVVAVTAAMSDGTGLTEFSKRFPNRYFDVGIAEQHAVSMCAGFQKAGLKPYFAVYSSFLQRAYDQVLSDVCIDNRGVTLLIDHAGVVGGDGVTHQGIYDISYLCAMPNMTIMQPKDGIELKNMMQFSLSYDRPLAIRYPKSYKTEFSEHKPIDDLSWEWIRKTNSNVYVLAVGNKMLEIALKNDNVNIISARVIKPLDEKLLAQIKNGVVITMEEGVLRGGFGEMIKSFYSNNADVKVHTLGFNDRFFDCLEEDAIFDSANLTIDALNGIVKKCL